MLRLSAQTKYSKYRLSVLAVHVVDERCGPQQPEHIAGFGMLELTLPVNPILPLLHFQVIQIDVAWCQGADSWLI